MFAYLCGDCGLGAVCPGEGEVNGPDPDHEPNAALRIVKMIKYSYKIRADITTQNMSYVDL